MSNFSLTRIIILIRQLLREFPSCFFVLWPSLVTSPYSNHEWFWPELKLDHTVSRRDCENGLSPCLESSSEQGEHLLLCSLGHLYHNLGSLCSSDVGCLFIPWKHKTLSSSSLRILTLDACFAGATLSVVWGGCALFQVSGSPSHHSFCAIAAACVLPYRTDFMTCVICIHSFSQCFLQENVTPKMSFSSSLLPELIQWGDSRRQVFTKWMECYPYQTLSLFC